MSEQKHYTATDIERYHSGQLSAAEMHALEKAALDDPFLADALEGYTVTPTPGSDLSVLQQKLRLRIEKEDKPRGLVFLRTPWMRIAALFVLVAGGGWLVVQMFNNNSKDVATVERAPQQQETVAAPATVPDSGNVTTIEKLNEQPVANDVAKEQSSSNENVIAMKKTRPTSSSSAQPMTMTAPVQSQSNIQQLDAAEVYTMRQATTDSVIGGTTIVSANATDKLKLKGTDSIKDLHIVLTPTGDEPESIVVNKSFSNMPRTRKQNIVIDTLEPAEGWTRFDDYIATNLKTPDEFKTKPVRGEVELSFEVNREGEPVNITVVKSLCEKCDEEAIRLLKEGPKWKKNKKKGKVKIKF